MSRTYKPVYRRSRVFDPSCRCHGSCGWCWENRTYQARKARAAAEYALRDFFANAPYRLTFVVY